jgi:hypothetical protein
MHNIGDDGKPTDEQNPEDAEPSPKRPAIPAFIDGGRLQKGLFKRFLLEWMIAAHIAFLQNENTYFRRFLCFLNSAVEQVLPESSTTIRTWIEALRRAIFWQWII